MSAAIAGAATSAVAAIPAQMKRFFILRPDIPAPVLIGGRLAAIVKRGSGEASQNCDVVAYLPQSGGNTPRARRLARVIHDDRV
jgi:hypothetical protein